MSWWHDETTDEDEQHIRRIPLRSMLRRILPLFRPHVRTLVIAMLLLFVTVAAELGGPLIIRHVLDTDIPAGDKGGVLLRGLLYALLYAIGMTAAYIQVIMICARRAARSSPSCGSRRSLT